MTYLRVIIDLMRQSAIKFFSYLSGRPKITWSITALIFVAVIAFLGYQSWQTEKAKKQTPETAITFEIKGKLADAKFSQKTLEIKKGQVLALEIIGEVFEYTGSKELIDLRETKKFSPVEFIAFQLSGEEKWQKIPEGQTVLHVISETDSELKFGNICPGYTSLGKFYTMKIVGKGYVMAPIKIKYSYIEEKKYDKSLAKLEPVKTTQEKILPDFLKVERKPRDFDLREKARQGYKENQKPDFHDELEKERYGYREIKLTDT